MATVLVTGAKGFTGRHLCRQLAARGWQVWGLAQTNHADDPGIIACDLRDVSALAAVVAELQPTHVVHLAGIAHTVEGGAEDYYRTHVIGTQNLLDALLASGAPITRVLLASTAHVYGNPGVDVLNEGLCPAPTSHYAISKLAMEYLARSYADRLSLVAVRPFNYTGRGQGEGFVIPKLVARYRARAMHVDLGNTQVIREFNDVRNAVECYESLLVAPEVPSVVNLCSGRGVALEQVIAWLDELAGYRIKVRVNPAFVRRDDPPRLIGDVTRLAAVVGHREVIPFRDTLAWMLADSDSGIPCSAG